MSTAPSSSSDQAGAQKIQRSRVEQRGFHRNAKWLVFGKISSPAPGVVAAMHSVCASLIASSWALSAATAGARIDRSCAAVQFGAISYISPICATDVASVSIECGQHSLARTWRRRRAGARAASPLRTSVIVPGSGVARTSAVTVACARKSGWKCGSKSHGVTTIDKVFAPWRSNDLPAENGCNGSSYERKVVRSMVAMGVPLISTPSTAPATARASSPRNCLEPHRRLRHPGAAGRRGRHRSRRCAQRSLKPNDRPRPVRGRSPYPFTNGQPPSLNGRQASSVGVVATSL